MKRSLVLLCTLVTVAVSAPRALTAGLPPANAPGIVVLHGVEATPNEVLAAREVRRYVYLRTGRLLPVLATQDGQPRAGGAIVVARKDSPLARPWVTDHSLTVALESLQPGQFWLRTFKAGGQSTVLLTGGDDVGTLYAAYRFAEILGVRFYLHGDVVPDTKTTLELDLIDERQMPLFGLRGIQPFHDFPEGPDWWNTDDYAAIIAQLPKLRMNFFALHTYPEGAPNAEPTVWIGVGADADPQGRVSYSYPASYMNTLRGNWGYQAKPTGEFLFGADRVFEADAFGSDVMLGHCPQPTRGEDCNTVFNQTGEMLRQAFTLARRLGVKTCVGTETPLMVPQWVRNRLKTIGKDAGDPQVRRELYAGLFQRAAAAYPLDYYWFWTPEGWTWEGTKEDQVKRTLDDLQAAMAAAKDVNAPFRLATCGWVLGPQQDRALFDKVLPKEIAVSCINREVGRTPVDRGFAEVSGRGKWAIPWLEDDPALTAPQLWVGRMRRDAADARRYGCDGLMGIHWRTRVLAPNVAALAQAAWNQDGWNKDPLAAPAPTRRADGPVGGSSAAFPNNPIADTQDSALYQTVRYNLSAYNLSLPNGTYTVTLKFCEPHYREAGKRVFGVRLQGRSVIDRLDLFAKVGANRALDFRFDEVAVTNEWLVIDFVPIVEFPSVAAIAVEGPAGARRINCGGPAHQDFEADAPSVAPPSEPFAPVSDFYLDWARHEFGEEVGPVAGRILEEVDCRLPRPADWVDGPGGIRPDPRPWAQVRPQYDFVSEFEALTRNVRGTGNRARFDYWVETFRYLRAMAELNCTWAAYNGAIVRAKAAESPSLKELIVDTQALPLRRQMVSLLRAIYGHLLATVSNPGEMGTLANWDQHLVPGLLTKPAEELAQLLGGPLPPDARPDQVYRGSARVFLPTARGSIVEGEKLKVKAIVVSSQPTAEGWLRWRKLGTGAYQPVPLQNLGRGVYAAELPAKACAADFEYYVEVVEVGGKTLRAPVTAPSINQTVVVMPAT